MNNIKTDKQPAKPFATSRFPLDAALTSGVHWQFQISAIVIGTTSFSFLFSPSFHFCIEVNSGKLNSVSSNSIRIWSVSVAVVSKSNDKLTEYSGEGTQRRATLIQKYKGSGPLVVATT